MVMKVLDMTSGRKTYTIELTYSILFEAALGIAVSTYPQIQNSLEKSDDYWEMVKVSLSSSLQEKLGYAQKHNTWKILLQLLHQKDFKTLDSFLAYVKTLDEVSLRYHALPYAGEFDQQQRIEAVQGNREIQKLMLDSCSEHMFFPELVSYVYEIEIEELREHLLAVMKDWYKEVITPEEKNRSAMLERDYHSKKEMLAKLPSEEFVKWATGGTEYQPEPTVKKVLLVPHYVYRPWNIQAEMEGIKVFYYPMADENMEENVDIYKPALSLVQHYKALGDENRLRIVKWLYEKDRTLQELTEHLELAKSTIHHHLTLLRSAHIVRSEGMKYVLNRDSLFFGAKELNYFLDKERDRS
jgi:DNA-binding transcriptional ArsR family regulator